MTTFTSEDRIEIEKLVEPNWYDKWGSWEADIKRGLDYSQTRIEFFWPLTEQIPLELDYTESVKYSNLITQSTYPLNDGTAMYTMPLWGAIGTNSITPQLMVESQDTKGYLKIGGVKIGLDKKPSQFRTMLHKLLGFDWSDK